MASALPKITLYTSDTSVYGHRVSILLLHLRVPYEKVLIPLDRPRERWYLEINPRGLVPALQVEDPTSGQKHAVVESSLICEFLLDLAPGWGDEYAARAQDVLPRGHSLAVATQRYQRRLFVGVHFEGIRSASRPLLGQATEEAQQAFLAAARGLESVCPPPGRYFGDSDTVTFVEVLTGPFFVRLEAHLRWELVRDARAIHDRLRAEAPRFYAWLKFISADPKIRADAWNEEVQHRYLAERIAKAQVAAQEERSVP
ncbi:uncharacterized protein PV09_09345 [Verruconis gallopava]|uniref:GST N-terminal domain-containing protein n=1 Tax=Verruconis gallopava TaxID=253628 RepID=A0A0D1ZXU3_9PEZI|nr:uncharacterized protein PV09_09345 [Verruconis gallopava]KIV98899.1 hypothetical protein PV09_09345 [Verruconis gallopava]